LFHRNSYTYAGFGLLIAGSLISPVAYFILHLSWLAALGISMLILSFVLLALAKTIPRLSPEICSLLLETGIDNIATVIEELGIKNKAVYLPSSLTNDRRPRALVPLHARSALPTITKALPQRLIVRYGTNPDDVGLLLSTIGSTAFAMLDSKPDPNSIEIESALNTLFAGRLGVADGTSVICNGEHVRVEINNPHLENGASWSHHCLGGPYASVIASIAAEAWNKPVTITHEQYLKGKFFVEVRVIGDNI
jgi:hypothetical protein